MSDSIPEGHGLELAPCGLAEVLRNRGFKALTAVQAAVLRDECTDRDLRITSQTGSGKTVALGLMMAECVQRTASSPDGRPRGRDRRPATPVALVVAPTRELANQLGEELRWLFAGFKARVMTVTGGTSVFRDKEMLWAGPNVVVGTPGRLCDHLRGGALKLDALEMFGIDEADEMLDMNFEEELDQIVGHLSGPHRTHMVSATFQPRVRALADKYQNKPLAVQGTKLGDANEDIEHVSMLINVRLKHEAVINILLRHPNDKALLFARTRAGSAKLADLLFNLGFPAGALHGEMTQRERTSTFQRFRSGQLRVLVATDVAARGLDVQDIDRVIHVDLPDNAEVFTHRSGRTGRAGRRGQNIVLVPASGKRRADGLFRAAKVVRVLRERPPSAESIQKANDERFAASIDSLLQDAIAKPDETLDTLAASLLEKHDSAALVKALLQKSRPAPLTAPRHIPSAGAQNQGANRKGRDDDRGPRRRGQPDGVFVTFQASFGRRNNAEPARLLAIACRRGNITRKDVGAIRINDASSTIEVSEGVANEFERSASLPDTRDPNVRFRRFDAGAGRTERSGKPRGQYQSAGRSRPAGRGNYEKDRSRPFSGPARAPARAPQTPTPHAQASGEPARKPTSGRGVQRPSTDDWWAEDTKTKAGSDTGRDTSRDEPRRRRPERKAPVGGAAPPKRNYGPDRSDRGPRVEASSAQPRAVQPKAVQPKAVQTKDAPDTTAHAKTKQPKLDQSKAVQQKPEQAKTAPAERATPSAPRKPKTESDAAASAPKRPKKSKDKGKKAERAASSAAPGEGKARREASGKPRKPKGKNKKNKGKNKPGRAERKKAKG